MNNNSNINISIKNQFKFTQNKNTHYCSDKSIDIETHIYHIYKSNIKTKDIIRIMISKTSQQGDSYSMVLTG